MITIVDENLLQVSVFLFSPQYFQLLKNGAYRIEFRGILATMTQPEQHMIAQSVFKLQLPTARNVFLMAPALGLCAWITQVCILCELQGL